MEKWQSRAKDVWGRWIRFLFFFVHYNFMSVSVKDSKRLFYSDLYNLWGEGGCRIVCSAYVCVLHVSFSVMASIFGLNLAFAINKAAPMFAYCNRIMFVIHEMKTQGLNKTTATAKSKQIETKKHMHRVFRPPETENH